MIRLHLEGLWGLQCYQEEVTYLPPKFYNGVYLKVKAGTLVWVDFKWHICACASWPVSCCSQAPDNVDGERQPKSPPYSILSTYFGKLINGYWSSSLAGKVTMTFSASLACSMDCISPPEGIGRGEAGSTSPIPPRFMNIVGDSVTMIKEL